MLKIRSFLVVFSATLAVAGCPLPSTAPMWFSPEASVLTLAGNGKAGYVDGHGDKALFSENLSLAVSASGDLYVADSGNHRIRKLSPDGLVTTLAGSGEIGDRDGAGTAAEFSALGRIAIAPSGDLYVEDGFSIRKVTSDGVVTTLVASGGLGVVGGHDENPAAQFVGSPVGVDPNGNVIVMATSAIGGASQRLLKVSPSGAITVWRDFPPSDRKGNGVKGAAVAADGAVYLAKVSPSFLWFQQQSTIVRITPSGGEEVIAGGGQGFTDGNGSGAQFSWGLGDIAADPGGNIYVADYGNHRIRRVSPTGEVRTIAGSGDYRRSDGNVRESGILLIHDVAADHGGNVYCSEFSTIRKVSTN